jgi:hypothetical protein
MSICDSVGGLNLDVFFFQQVKEVAVKKSAVGSEKYLFSPLEAERQVSVS